ncbi:MAG: Uma2 family endonuclease [Geothrix sp.]|nr:Uma2 family endonuclease [Geothrix sp.]
MSLPELKHPGYTVEDWKLWDGRWEIINGVAYDMTPAPTLEHQRISSKLHLAIGNALEAIRRSAEGGECEIFAAPVDVYLGDAVVQPDLLVICDPAKKSERGIEGAPDLVVEILSPSTASKDYSRKRWTYEAAGIPEYLIIDPDERFGLLLCLDAGRYVETARVEWGAVVALLDGKVGLTLG